MTLLEHRVKRDSDTKTDTDTVFTTVILPAISL